MADLKISQLTSITTLTPATDVLPVVDVGGITKKITTNQILGSGGTATLASATITGDLTVDTSTLKVNSSANRVGILTASPESELDVRGLIAVRGTPTFPTTGVGPEIFWSPSNSNSNIYSYNRGTSAWAAMAYGASSHTFQLSGSDAMTLNSTGLNVANGNVILGTSGKGIDFSATANGSGTMTSELLNDYEEGTWTPTAGDASSGGNQATTASAVGRYTKIGRLVTVHFELADINTTGLTAGNSMNVRGLPFAASSAATQFGTIAGAGITFTGFLTCGVYNGNSFPIYATSTGGSLADIKVSGFASGTADIFGTLTYFV